MKTCCLQNNTNLFEPWAKFDSNSTQLNSTQLNSPQLKMPFLTVNCRFLHVDIFLHASMLDSLSCLLLTSWIQKYVNGTVIDNIAKTLHKVEYYSLANETPHLTKIHWHGICHDISSISAPASFARVGGQLKVPPVVLSMIQDWGNSVYL